MSVAGLIALGPLTDSLGNQVVIPPNVATASGGNSTSKQASAVVPVSISLNVPVGKTATAALKTSPRGGKATIDSATNGSAGLVSTRVRPGTTVRATTAAHTTTTHTAANSATTAKPKVKRPTSLGGVSESNSDQGLAGGNQATTHGEQSSTLAP